MRVIGFICCLLSLPLAAQDEVMPILRQPVIEMPVDPVVKARELRPKDPGASVSFYREAVVRSPDDAALRRELAEVLATVGQFQGAVEEMRRAWELAPAAETAVRLIELQIAATMPVGAALVAEEALKLYPDDQKLLAAAAVAMAAAGQGTKAMAIAEKLAAAGGSDPVAVLARARAMQAAGRAAEAWKLVAGLSGDEAAHLREQLKSNALAGASVLFFPPPDWRLTRHQAQSPDGLVAAEWKGPLTGEPGEIARGQAAGRFAPMLEPITPPEEMKKAPPASFTHKWEVRTWGDGVVGGVLLLTLPMPNGEESFRHIAGALAVQGTAGCEVLLFNTSGSPDELWPVLDRAAAGLVSASPMEGR